MDPINMRRFKTKFSVFFFFLQYNKLEVHSLYLPSSLDTEDLENRPSCYITRSEFSPGAAATAKRSVSFVKLHT